MIYWIFEVYIALLCLFNSISEYVLIIIYYYAYNLTS